MLHEKYHEKKPTSVGIQLRKWRWRGNFTQKEVSFGTGIHPTKICKYEGGKQLPSPHNLKILINFYRYYHSATEGEINTFINSYELEVTARGYTNQPAWLLH